MGKGPPKAIGPFEVVRELGRGGMGAVYEVVQPDTGRRMALKLVLGAEEILIRRFQREAEVMARIEHENVVRVFGSGESPEGPYLLSELVPGEDLASCVRQRGPFPPDEAARIVAALADAFVAVHAAGIIHRDLKPGNAILRPDGAPVLLDFGLARDDLGERLTRSAAFLGTPSFMAPEQLGERHEVGPWTDVYALGALLLFLLTGRPPYGEGLSSQEVIKKLLTAEPVWPSVDQPGTPPALEAIVKQAMARARTDRLSRADELLAALNDYLAGTAPAVRTRRGRGLAPAGVLVLVAAAVAIGLVLRGARPERPEPPGPGQAAAGSASEPTPLGVGSPAPAREERWPVYLRHPSSSTDEIPDELRVAFAGPRRALTWGKPSPRVQAWDLSDPGDPSVEKAVFLPGSVAWLAQAGAGKRTVAVDAGKRPALFELDFAGDGAARPLELVPPEGGATALAVSPEGDRIALGTRVDHEDGSQRRGWVQVWVLRAAGGFEPDGPPIDVSPEHATELAFVPGKPWLLVACGDSGGDKVLSAARGSLWLVRLDGSGPPVRAPGNVVRAQGMALAVLSSELAAVGDSGMRIVLVRLPGLEPVEVEGQPEHLLGERVNVPKETQAFWSALSHSGTLRGLDGDGKGGLWSLSGELRERFEYGNELRVWDPATRANPRAILNGAAYFCSLDLSPDGELLLIGHGFTTASKEKLRPGRAELWRVSALPPGIGDHPVRSYPPRQP